MAAGEYIGNIVSCRPMCTGTIDFGYCVYVDMAQFCPFYLVGLTLSPGQVCYRTEALKLWQ